MLLAFMVTLPIALAGALDAAGPSFGGPLIHLTILLIAYSLIARLALRRFTAV